MINCYANSKRFQTPIHYRCARSRSQNDVYHTMPEFSDTNQYVAVDKPTPTIKNQFNWTPFNSHVKI
jgi:hypothetical protein